MKQSLSVTDHSRDSAGLTYVYPVVSRRAGGVSIGINFNTNNACNWRCVYCQVPDLQRGSAPELDYSILANELKTLLQQIRSGAFFQIYQVPEPLRIIKDIAVSGNGEPTSLKGFSKAVQLIVDIAQSYDFLTAAKLVLITNGSLLHQQDVQQGIRLLNQYNGEVWFKWDSASKDGLQAINQAHQPIEKLKHNLILCTQLCRTKLQTCLLEYLPESIAKQEQQDYLTFLSEMWQQQIPIETILLYTLARPSFQPEAEQLKSLDGLSMQRFAQQIKALGYSVSVSL